MTRFLSCAVAVALVLSAGTVAADPLACTLTGYKAAPGLTATVAGNVLTLAWDGDKTQEVRLRLGVEGGTPTLRELAVHRKSTPWAVLATNVTPEFRVVAGFRRMSNQQLPLMRGDYWITSGEVLIDSYAVEGTGSKRTISAEVEWTFPLEFVEVVWGDGRKTGRQIISASDVGAFGAKRFSIPFDATGKDWVRLSAWDVAANGAFTEPVRLSKASTTTAGSR